MRKHAPGEHSLSVSIGVASARPGEAATLDELIAGADDAMYAGRRRRRRRPQRA